MMHQLVVIITVWLCEMRSTLQTYTLNYTISKIEYLFNIKLLIYISRTYPLLLNSLNAIYLQFFGVGFISKNKKENLIKKNSQNI